MADSANPWQVETQGSAGRAIATLAIALPITLSGKDANGVEFKEKTRTIVIDKFGGKIATKFVLSLGSEMTLHNPIAGQTARIRVVWVGEKRTAEEPYEIGVELMGSQNIWGIAFPPYDRQESALPAPRVKMLSPQMPAGAAPSPGQPTAPEFAVSDASSSMKPAETGRTGLSFTPPTMKIPRPSPLAVAVATTALPVEESSESIEGILTRLTQPIEAAGENEARRFQEEPEELSHPIALLTQTNLHDTALHDAPKGFDERESSVEEHVKTLEGDLQACRTQVQQLVAELEDLKHAVKDEMEKALREVQENRPKIVELVMGDLEMKVREEIDSVTNQSIALTQRRVQEEVAADLGPLIQGALERVHSVAEEQSARAGEGIQGQLSRLIEEGQEQLGRMLQSATSEFRQESHHISGTTIASTQAEIATAWSKSALGFEAQLQNTADEVAEAAAKQLQKQAEDTLLLLGEELKTSGNDCIKRLEESLAQAEGEQQKSALSSFRKALEQECAEALARMKSDLAQTLQAVSEQAARQASALNDLRKAVEEESLQTLANVKGAATQTIGEISGQIERQANALKDLHEEVQEESAKTLAKAKSDANQTMRGVSEQVGRDMEALNDLRKALVEESAQALPKFQEDLGQAMGEVTDQVQQQMNMLCSLLNLIEKESAQISCKVKNDLAAVLAENSLLAEQHMKSTQAALSDWETQMGSRAELQIQQLEGKTRASLETLQEQSEELLKSTLEKLRSESRELPAQIEASLKKAAGNIEQNWLERIQGKQQQVADEILEASAAQLGKQLEETLDLFGEELKLKQEQAASGVAEAFRSKMVEMLSAFQSPPRSSPSPAQSHPQTPRAFKP